MLLLVLLLPIVLIVVLVGLILLPYLPLVLVIVLVVIRVHTRKADLYSLLQSHLISRNTLLLALHIFESHILLHKRNLSCS